MRSIAGLVTFLFLAVTPMLGSQTAVHGTLQGTVKDQDGDPIRGAAVTVVNEATGAERHVVTGGGGRFRVFALPVEKYSIKVELEGFRTYSVSGVGVTSGASVRIRVVLKAAAEEIPDSGSPADPPRPEARDVPSSPPTAVPADDGGPRDPDKRPLSTISIDVDTASYADISRFISQGLLPPKDAVRVEELINYFSYEYPPPSQGVPFSITTELGGCPWHSGHRLLLVGVQGRGVAQAAGRLVTIAKDVEIQVRFDPARVETYRLIGSENRMLGDEGSAASQQGANEIAAGHSVTALYEIVPVGESAAVSDVEDPASREEGQPSRAAPNSDLARVTLRYKDPEAGQTWLLTFPVRDTGSRGGNLGFVAAVAEFGMILQDSEHKGQASHDQVLELARRYTGEDPEGRRADFIRLVEAAKQLR